MIFQTLGDDLSIEGVFEAKQERSIAVRDQLIREGIDALNSNRFSDLRVTDITSRVGRTVGSFYARFLDKEAFLRAIRAAAISMTLDECERRASAEILLQLPPGEALDVIVDLLTDIFSGPIRGVLRESRLRILDPDEPWAPMREVGSRIIENMHNGIEPNLSCKASDTAKIRLSYCFQIVVGILHNDLVNDNHVFSATDGTLRPALKETLRKYMDLEVSPH